MSLVDVLMIEKAKARRERVIIQSVLERLRNRLKSTVRANERYCVFEIPVMIPGHPLVDIERTMAYLVKKLTREGFIVTRLSYDALVITWNVADIRRLSELAPKSSVSFAEDSGKAKDPGFADQAFLDNLVAAKRIAKN